MIKMEYILLPTINLSQRFMYKLSGEVNSEWKEDRISHILLNPQDNLDKSMKSFARGQAALMIYNQLDKPGGELDMHKHTEIKLTQYDINIVDKYPDTPTPERGSLFVETDKLVIEYLHLPAKDTEYLCLMRFKLPMETVWAVRRFGATMRDVVGENGKLRQFNRHVGLKNAIVSIGQGEWYRLITENTEEKNYPEEAKWLFDLKTVEVRPCKLVKKS